jgi:hypothetical protein
MDGSHLPSAGPIARHEPQAKATGNVGRHGRHCQQVVHGVMRSLELERGY